MLNLDLTTLGLIAAVTLLGLGLLAGIAIGGKRGFLRGHMAGYEKCRTETARPPRMQPPASPRLQVARTPERAFGTPAWPRPAGLFTPTETTLKRRPVSHEDLTRPRVSPIGKRWRAGIEHTTALPATDAEETTS